MSKEVQVDIWYSENMADVGLTLNSSDNTPLTAQEILDAVAEALMLNYPNGELKTTSRRNAH